MDILANRNFRKSIKNYKNILNGVIIVNFTIIVGNALFSIILSGSLNYTSLLFNLFIDFIILLSFLLYSSMAKKILDQLMGRELEDIFKLFRSLNYFSFIFIFLIYFPFFYLFYIKGLIILVLIVECFRKYFKIKKREIKSKLQNDILLGLIFVVLGMVILLIKIFLYFTDEILIEPVFVLIGMVLMNNKATTYFSIQNLEFLRNLQKIPQIINQSKISGQISENIAKQDPEKKVIKAESKPDFVKKSEMSTKEEINQQIPETMTLKADVKTESIKQQEIAIKEDTPKPIPAIAVLKKEPKSELVKLTRITPEEEITPKKIETKRSGFFNFKINRNKVSEKPIWDKSVKIEAKPLVSKKKCPFCGKEHDDLNTPFCYACGYKF